MKNAPRRSLPQGLKKKNELGPSLKLTTYTITLSNWEFKSFLLPFTPFYFLFISFCSLSLSFYCPARPNFFCWFCFCSASRICPCMASSGMRSISASRTFSISIDILNLLQKNASFHIKSLLAPGYASCSLELFCLV